MRYKAHIFIFSVFLLFGCSKDQEQLADYHNNLVNMHNEIRIMYRELVDDFGWIISGDTTTSERRSFAKEYKSHFRSYKREIQNIKEIEEDKETRFRKSVLDLLDYLIEATDSLTHTARILVQSSDTVMNLGQYDSITTVRFDAIEDARNRFCKMTGLTSHVKE